MPLYFAHVHGRGQGCDYHIACNQKFEPLQGAKTLEDAKRVILEKYHDCIVRDCDGNTVAAIEVYAVSQGPITLDLAEYKAKDKAREQEEERVSSENSERAAYERLKKKFG